MLIMLIHGFEKVAKGREMSIMLITFFWRKYGQATKSTNIINISLVLATFGGKFAQNPGNVNYVDSLARKSG